MEYRYILVGAGSAGCVLANRLTANPDNTVLVIEAGGSDRHLNVRVPAAFSKLFKTKRDWDFQSEPEPYLKGREVYIPRGRMLGGSSSMNAMIYIRGRRQDYDDWRDSGCVGWGYDDVLAYFTKSEHNERLADEYHGTGGELNVADLRTINPATEAFVDACDSWGMSGISDFNGAAQDRAGTYQVTQKNGARWSAADTFLAPIVDRLNLTVKTGATVSRVLMEAGRAVGVEYVVGSVRNVARCSGEIIVCAGSINSPQILMLSGIGPATHLQEHDIDVKHDLPAGDGLQDHPAVMLVYDSLRTGTLDEAERLRHLVRYLARKDGMLSSNVGEGGAFVRTRDDLDAADIQFHFGPAYFVDHGFETYDGNAYTFGPTLISPESRGQVRLRSADPSDKVRIEGNYLSREHDVLSLVAGLRIGRELGAQPAFDSYRGREMYPGLDFETDAELEEYCRQVGELLYHPTGTCAMGPPGSAVVDPQLRVNGVERLRVVDASIMPTITGGNTNAPTIMIAERASDMILSG